MTCRRRVRRRRPCPAIPRGGLCCGRLDPFTGFALALVDGSCKVAGNLADCAGGCGDGDEARGVPFAAKALDTVAWGEEGVEALDERGVAAEEGGDPVDDAGRVDAVGRQYSGQRTLLRTPGP